MSFNMDASVNRVGLVFLTCLSLLTSGCLSGYHINSADVKYARAGDDAGTTPLRLGSNGADYSNANLMAAQDTWSTRERAEPPMFSTGEVVGAVILYIVVGAIGAGLYTWIN